MVYLRYDITDTIYYVSTERAKHIPITNGKTWEKNFIGALGVTIWQCFLKDCIYVDKQSHDLIYLSERLEIKSRTIKGNLEPKDWLEFLIPIRELDQNCFWYGFAAIHESHKFGWILGYLPNERVKNSEKVYKGGSIGKIKVLESDNYIIYLKDMYNANHLKSQSQGILPF